MTKILVIEDDPKIRRLLIGDLTFEGYEVSPAADGAEGLKVARKINPDLIVLDLNLPEVSGFDVCRTLRKEGSRAMILILTAKMQETDKVVGLDLGADDYMTKPFGGLEFLSRVKALLRRRSGSPGEKLTSAHFNGINVDFKRLEALKGKTRILLTVKEFEILELLIRCRGEVVTRERFLQEVWGYDVDLPTTRTVDNQVVSLRQKLGGKQSPCYIDTVHGAGYKFIGNVQFAKG